MLVWFATIAVLGVMHIGDAPRILSAFLPTHGLRFLAAHGYIGFLVLGSVFLAVTGAEALYADMGHFGQKPIRAGWYLIVFPALILNYLGQGAWALAQPAESLVRDINPFYNMAPSWAQIPLVIIATLAAIIASQALISGAFSTTMQIGRAHV